MKEDILGYGVDDHSVDQCADSLFAVLRSPGSPRGCVWLACLNPHSYAVARNDELFSRALQDADWLAPDGAGIVLASRLLGGGIRERVTGSDVFRELHRRMNAAGGMSVFFLGSTEETLALIRARMARDYPAVRVTGTYSPPFKPAYSPAELDAMVDAVNTTAPDVLWVGMTAPKQEKWIYENRARLNVKFAGAIGAVFEFYTGRVKRSHPAFQKLGLEWLPRLLQQPRRLWRRMFISAPVFMFAVLRARVQR
ncbi:MAG: WecB/TagA/CpsF family glycosyltransferase [Acidobacteria bacterium]|nr:WecB/TagA/CpsF family glycosyltransferase [Acidobacteriota bacterium]